MSSNPRLFVPVAQIRNNPSQTLTKPSDILHYDAETRTRKLIMYALFAPATPRVVQNSLVAAISGTSKNSKASYGVFFAPDSPLNTTGLLPDSVSGGDGELRASFYAISKTLDTVEEKFGQTSKLVVLTASKSVAEGLAERVWDWEFNGYRDAKGKDVADAELFKEMHRRISRLESGGMDVSFWQVPREWNLEAAALTEQ